MYRYFIIPLLIFIVNTTDAQNGYSIKVSGGLGSGYNRANNPMAGNIRTNSAVSAFTAVTIGYRFSKIRLIAGFGILGSSYNNEFTLQPSMYDPLTGAYLNAATRFKVYDIYRYFIVPVTAGYTWNIGRKLAIVPEVGLMPAYNMSMIRKYENMETKDAVSYTQKAGKVNSLFSLSGIAALNIEYYVTGKIGFLTGVTYAHTLTNLQNAFYKTTFDATQRQTIYTINLGVIIRI